VRSPPLDDIEARALEHPERPLEGLRRRDSIAMCLDRVGLDERGPMLPRVGDSRVQQRASNPLSTGRARNDEADDRPDRLVINRTEDLRMLKPLVIVPWSYADPADCPPVLVRDKPGLST